MAMADAAERGLWRGRRGRLLVGAVGLLFAAAVVRERQRVWERGQEPRPVSLGEDDYARELGAGGESPAQRLAALHRALARTSLQLQGSDRARSRAIRREETLAERPPQSPGFEQGASAEWAAGGATNLARRELATHRMLAGGGQGRASSVDEVLAQSAQALRRDIERQERNARGEQLAQAPGAPAARATPASAAPQPAAPLAAAAESQAWPQQLSQVWQGTGAVYAPSVMTSYQQQMLQSYMGAPTLASPPSVQSATPTSQLQGGTQQQQPRGDAPPTGLHGPALAAAWKAYLDPETAPAHSPAAAAPVSVSAPQPAPAAAYISELPAVGKAVENVAVDSDGVLEHAESLMSSVKKLLKKPEHDLTQAATQAATSARQAVAAAKESKGQTQRVTKVMTKEITKATKATKSLKSLIAAAKAEHSKLESERSHLLARQYKQLAASIPAPHRREGNKDSEQYETLRKELVTRIEGDVRALEQARVDTKGANKRIRAGLTDPARTESLAAVPVAPKEGQGSGKGENVSVAALSRSNASSASSHLHAVRGESKADKAVSGHVQPHVEAAAGLAKGTGSGLTALPQLPVLPHVAGASLVGSAPAASASAVQPPADAQSARAVKLQEHSRGPQADKGGKSGRGAAEDAYTPVINVNIHDSKIDGGLRISRNTGERKGAGAQSGCGALCQLGKLVRNIQSGEPSQVVSVWGAVECTSAD